ncbi:MAG TPA: hypothetical protein VLL07_06850, partial [Pontiella sp.]|nr:hypothetical protein [Pontiella sp.]
MSTIVVSPSNVVTFPEGGGHFWVCMQYVQGLLAQGCEVYWMERFTGSGDTQRDVETIRIFRERAERFGLKDKIILYSQEELNGAGTRSPPHYIGVTEAFAESVFRRADLLINFYYSMDPQLLANFKRTALVDIDPGLLQFWISTDQLSVSRHDFYLTTGETVGSPDALFPDCGLDWIHIRPPVSLECWPFHYDPGSNVFTTISSWWGGGGKGEFITDGKGTLYENNKRVTFLQYVDLPRRTPQPLELALNLGEGDPENDLKIQQEKAACRTPGVTDYVSDAVDRSILLQHGWRLRDAYEAAKSPEIYQAYVQGARGEFSCVKPSCLKFRNAWISDRTICFLASGKPAVIQDTGPSRFLPNGEGM